MAPYAQQLMQQEGVGTGSHTLAVLTARIACPPMQWVADCVLHGQFPASRELKMAFQLLPLPVSGHTSACWRCVASAVLPRVAAVLLLQPWLPCVLAADPPNNPHACRARACRRCCSRG